VAEALRLVAATPPLDGAVLDVNLQGEMIYPLADVLMVRGMVLVFARLRSRNQSSAIPSLYALRKAGEAREGGNGSVRRGAPTRRREIAEVSAPADPDRQVPDA
jgi:hypothetical protein